MTKFAPAPLPSGLRESYELLRTRRRAAGRHAYTLFVNSGMAAWIRAAATLLGATEPRRRSAFVAADAGRANRGELPKGLVPDLVPLLAGLILGFPKGGEA